MRTSISQLADKPGPSLLLRKVGRSLGLGRAMLRLKHLRAMTLRGAAQMVIARRQYLTRILGTEPISAGAGPIEVHMLLEHKRIYEGIWSLYSFTFFCAKPCRVVIHDDGTLTEADRDKLSRIFPGCRVIPRSEADWVVMDYFRRQGLSRCAQLRGSLVLALKLFDPFFFLQNRFFIMLDSDVLFFSRPNELIDEIEERPQGDSSLANNLYFDDVGCSHCIQPMELARLIGRAPIERLNTGVLRANRDTIDFQRIDSYLEHPGFWTKTGSADYHAEQTLWAMELSIAGASPLPKTCAICPTVEEPDLVCGHFCGGGYGEILYYTRGLPRLAPIFLGTNRGSTI